MTEEELNQLRNITWHPASPTKGCYIVPDYLFEKLLKEIEQGNTKFVSDYKPPPHRPSCPAWETGVCECWD